jgi:formylglycine-generating enzyme required for sulfatase activity
MYRRDILLGSLGLALSGTASATATAQQAGQKRFALILANQTYEKNPLPNIDNDASLMAKTLTGLGFTVSTLMNGTRSTMRTKLKELKDNLAANPGGIGFVFYSGHGVLVGGETYLVPVNNGALTSEADVIEACLSLSNVLEMSKGTKAKAFITVLNASRDNPFRGQKGDGNKGIAVLGPTLDASTLVAFAASPGEKVSFTLSGSNSAYTTELVKQLQTPNLSLQEVFQNVRGSVLQKTNSKQQPRFDNGLISNVYLNGLSVPNPDSRPRRASRLTDYPALKAYVESFRLIPAGTFQMGSTKDYHEEPVHSVTLSPFRMGATPVTVAVWKEYCAATGTLLPDAPPWGLLDDHPVVNVSWNDIMGSDGKGGFCAWASDIAGFRLTLPTEAQFEYASRGGQSGLEYPWGNSFDRSKLWCSVTRIGDAGKTAPVTRSLNIFRNSYGLTDMSGNVWQWCSDLYGPYSSSSQNDPTGPPSMSANDRCVRGGSWIDKYPGEFRCAYRYSELPDGWDVPTGRGSYFGFRLSAGLG